MANTAYASFVEQNYDQLLQALVVDLSLFVDRLQLCGVRISPWNTNSGWIIGSTNNEMWTYHCGLSRILMVLAALEIPVRRVEDTDELLGPPESTIY